MDFWVRFNLLLFIVLLYSSGFVFAQFTGEPHEGWLYTPIICVVCVLYLAFYYVAGIIASLVFVIAGVKWVMSQSDPGERKQAKTTMQAAILGLIAVLIAGEVIGAVGTMFEFGGRQGCEDITSRECLPEYRDGSGGEPTTTLSGGGSCTINDCNGVDCTTQGWTRPLCLGPEDMCVCVECSDSQCGTPPQTCTSPQTCQAPSDPLTGMCQCG